jgi:hypothetical protein
MVFIPIFPSCVGEAEVAAVAVCWAQFFLVAVVEVEAVVVVVVAFWLV